MAIRTAREIIGNIYEDSELLKPSEKEEGK